MSDQPELFAGDELAGPVAETAPAETRGPGRVRDLSALPDGPLRRLMDGNFIQYASYVIRDRAIPDLDDGLKPVQRRILHSLHENDDGKFIKVANIVGYTMQYHPHGDASIGDALVALANKRYLIEGQGNFGNALTGDPAAAPRYIECRLTPLAREEIFHDDLTDFVPSYDGRRQEPVTLPARLPLLLMLGAEGIAVGISTRILPHNFRELIEAQIAILREEPFAVYPDFAQGGLMDVAGYDKGKGFVRLRARIEPRDASSLVIREIPAGTTTDSVIASIEEAGKKGKIKLRGINDYTAGGVEIEILLDEGQDAGRAVEALYAFTQCEVQVASRIMAICGGKPVELDVEQALRHHTGRLLGLLKRKLRLQQRQLTEELHRKTLVQIFVQQRLYKPIEECRTPEEIEAVVRGGVEPYRPQLQRDVTRGDVDMLLGIPIRRISLFDLERNAAEMEAIRTELAETGENLAHLTGYAIRYCRNLLKKYGDEFPRRTEIAAFKAVEVRDLTARELQIQHDRAKGYLGHKVAGPLLFECSSLDKLLLAWKDGRYKAVPPPEKLFVDATLVHAAVFDRDRVITVVYNEDGFTRIKKFPAAVVTNREYRCVPRGAQVLFFTDREVGTLYVRYEVPETVAIRQQEFDTTALTVRDRDGRGLMMTSKPVAYVGTEKPKGWDDAQTGPKGAFMDFG